MSIERKLKRSKGRRELAVTRLAAAVGDMYSKILEQHLNVVEMAFAKCGPLRDEVTHKADDKNLLDSIILPDGSLITVLTRKDHVDSDVVRYITNVCIELEDEEPSYVIGASMVVNVQ